MGLFAAGLTDQFHMGPWLPGPVVRSFASIEAGLAFGDLWDRGLLQFLPLLLVIVIFAFFSPGRISRRPIF